MIFEVQKKEADLHKTDTQQCMLCLPFWPRDTVNLLTMITFWTLGLIVLAVDALLGCLGSLMQVQQATES